jgi:hypothetical protein
MRVKIERGGFLVYAENDAEEARLKAFLEAEDVNSTAVEPTSSRSSLLSADRTTANLK